MSNVPRPRRLPRSEVDQEVRERFPDFDKRERHKLGVLTCRLQVLHHIVEEERSQNPADHAEIAALTWALAELEALEHE